MTQPRWSCLAVLHHASRVAHPEPPAEVINQPLSEPHRPFAGGSGPLLVLGAAGSGAPATAGRWGRMHSAHWTLHRLACAAYNISTFCFSCCNDQAKPRKGRAAQQSLDAFSAAGCLGECQARRAYVQAVGSLHLSSTGTREGERTTCHVSPARIRAPLKKVSFIERGPRLGFHRA
jgi:hypothetical protein